MRLAVCASALFVASAAHADSVSDQLTVAATQTTAQNPRAGSVSNLLRASFDLGERWVLSTDAQITFEESAGAPTGANIAFQQRGGTVVDFSVGLDFDLTDNWTVGATAGFSPSSTTRTVAQITVIDPATNRPANADGLIGVTNSSAFAEILGGYDTTGESDLEWSLTAAVALNRFETLQQLEAAQLDNGRLVRVDEVRTSAELRYAKLSGAATATLFADTDVTLIADYYAYEDDPRTVGYFSVGGAARATSIGAGVPIAPLHYLVRPELAHRFGDFSLKLWAQAGRYMPGTGRGTTGIGLKAQYRFTRWLKAWASAGGQSDVDSGGQSTRSGTFALGAAYRF
jgi:hypothetical protein